MVSALLLDAVGIPRETFTPDVRRVALRWLAHAMEQQKSGRMIWPNSRCVGTPTVD